MNEEIIPEVIEDSTITTPEEIVETPMEETLAPEAVEESKIIA